MSFLPILAAFAAQASAPLPIIDMHLHAQSATEFGPPGQILCSPLPELPPRDPSRPMGEYLSKIFGGVGCKRAFAAPKTDAEIRDRSLAELRRLNILGVTSGEAARVAEWHAREPTRIIPALSFGADSMPPIAELRRLHAAGRLKVLGEITTQYGGMGPNDARLEPYFALAEELDIPVAIHVGPGPPGVAYFAAPKYRANLSNALLLEEVLLRHPKMRIYAMHAGWPLGDAMVAMMYAHPQLYVDTGILDYAYPRADFHGYLKRLMDAGFGKRVMFGSDQMIWPDAIGYAVEGIETAAFLSREQKRDILYNNAARFLRLTP
jgi:hypothetical protein